MAWSHEEYGLAVAYLRKIAEMQRPPERVDE
jgi:hypothetical protein